MAKTCQHMWYSLDDTCSECINRNTQMWRHIFHSNSAFKRVKIKFCVLEIQWKLNDMK